MIRRIQMRNSMRVFCGGAVLLMAAGVLEAQGFVQPGSWPEPMFDKLHLDFGVVAKGAETKQRLKIVNTLPNPLHIHSAGTQCKCASARVLQDSIAPGETGYVEVTLDTKKFEGNRDTTVIVEFDRPSFAVVRIPVKAFIRNDVEIGPGKVEFGSVPKGTAAERRVQVIFHRPGGSVREVVNKNKDLDIQVREVGRNFAGGAIYELVATLKPTAAVGEFREQLTVVTEDEKTPQLPLIVEGRVEPEFSVTTELLDFGTLAPGKRFTQRLVIRGRRAFTIEKIESDTTVGVFEVQLPKEPRIVHVLPLTVIAPAEIGTLQDNFTITIAGGPEVTFKAQVRVVPSTAARP